MHSTDASLKRIFSPVALLLVCYMYLRSRSRAEISRESGLIDCRLATPTRRILVLCIYYYSIVVPRACQAYMPYISLARVPAIQEYIKFPASAAPIHPLPRDALMFVCWWWWLWRRVPVRPPKNTENLPCSRTRARTIHGANRSSSSQLNGHAHHVPISL